MLVGILVNLGPVGMVVVASLGVLHYGVVSVIWWCGLGGSDCPGVCHLHFFHFKDACVLILGSWELHFYTMSFLMTMICLPWTLVNLYRSALSEVIFRRLLQNENLIFRLYSCYQSQGILLALGVLAVWYGTCCQRVSCRWLAC